jgi:hypothetical protein
MGLETIAHSVQGGQLKRRDRISIEDRMEIQDIVSLPSLYVDIGDYRAAAQCYAKDAILDYASVFGPSAKALSAATYWTTVLDFMPAFDSSLHQTTNFDINVEGATATCVSAVSATLRLGGDIYSNGGIYRHTLIRTDEGWRISHQSYQRTFEEGESLLEKARSRIQR